MKKYLFLLLFLTGCSYANVDYIKDRADERWKQHGFKITGYDGYEVGFGVFNYGGAHVWYTLEKIPDNGITYTAALCRWGDEIHVYSLEAVDAIKP